jgi:hypothetical protein
MIILIEVTATDFSLLATSDMICKKMFSRCFEGGLFVFTTCRQNWIPLNVCDSECSSVHVHWSALLCGLLFTYVCNFKWFFTRTFPHQNFASISCLVLQLVIFQVHSNLTYFTVLTMLDDVYKSPSSSFCNILNQCVWSMTRGSWREWNFNPLRQSGNYMNHLLWQSVMLHFVFVGFAWFSL